MELNKILRKWGQNISSGDIFEVPLTNNKKGFFQFIFKDNHYLSGHLIRGFDIKIDCEQTLELQSIIESEIKFHTYTRVLQGLKDSLWVKIGNIEIPENIEIPYLRRTTDVGMKIEVSSNWIRTLPGSDEEKFIGKLDEITRNYDLARIFPPWAIVKWLDTGWHSFKIIG